MKTRLWLRLLDGLLPVLVLTLIVGCASTTGKPTPSANGNDRAGTATDHHVADGSTRKAPNSVHGTSGQPSTNVHRPTPLEMEEAAASRSPLKGVAAPAFTLLNQQEKPVSLDAMRGKWTILYFYPKDDTPGCTCQATEFTDILRRIHTLNAQVFGVSPDNPSSHRFFINKYKLGVTLLSDTDHKVMSQYGAYVPFKVGAIEGHRVVRSTFLIDPQGKIAYHWPEVIPQGHAARVRDKLAAIQKQATGS